MSTDEQQQFGQNSAGGVVDAVESYRVWATDNQVYGPVPLTLLLDWAKDQRIFRDTWIYTETQRRWVLAEAVSELKPLLPDEDTSLFLRNGDLGASVDPYELRLFPAMATLSSKDLAHFITLSELVEAPRGEMIIRRNDPGDSTYFLLSGSARVRIMVGYEEKLLNRIEPGQFIGEMTMFTGSRRAADVIAEEDCRFLRLTAESFRKLIDENPSAAAPMLYNIASTMAKRILDTNMKFQNEVAGGFVWR